MLRNLKIFLVLAIIFGMVATVGCDAEDTAQKKQANFADVYNPNDSWLVYWYVCGSDLESEGGAASADIEEMLNVPLPENVKVLIQAGGATQWQNAFVKAGKTNRLLYDKDGFHELGTLDDTNMGDASTLAGFLQYGKDNFQADHKVFIFWDHGGGSAYGVCLDERTTDLLDLNEIHDAFAAVYDNSAKNPPFEVIGFDTCLMATYELANDLYGFARYMVASEEVEPGNGWEYTGFLTALANNRAMGGAGLGQTICDSYYKGCESTWSEDSATLSVIDLSKIPQLRTAYENFGIEALKLSAQNSRKFFSNFGRSAESAENYSGNTRESGYYNMIDLGDLARNAKDLLPETSAALIDAVDDAVVYKVNGEYRAKGSGISGFYPYGDGEEMLDRYLQLYSAPNPQKYLYQHLIHNYISDEAKELLKTNIQTSTQSADKNIFTVEDLEDTKIKIDQNHNAYVKLTDAQIDILSSVHCLLAYVDVANDVILYLGSDSSVKADWDKGTFTDNFDAAWLMLNGRPVYVEVTADEEKYTLYSIPVKLNGVRCNLEVAYDIDGKEYKVLGARRKLDSKKVADKNLIKLKAGDKITTLHYGMSISGDDSDYAEVEVDNFTLEEDLATVKKERLNDGEYLYCFEFVAPNNKTSTSQYVNFTIKGDTITTTQLEE